MNKVVLVLSLLVMTMTVGCRLFQQPIVPVETLAETYIPKRGTIVQQAEEGNLDAMQVLAYQYEMGINRERDEALAAEWYLRAARKRSAEASYRLALIYANPDSPLYNHKSGKAWFRRATRLGHTKAEIRLHGYPRRPLK